MTSQSSETPTFFSVIQGNPTTEELAALTAVVASLASEQPAQSRPNTERTWVRKQRLRLRPTPGPDAWRRSAWD